MMHSSVILAAECSACCCSYSVTVSKCATLKAGWSRLGCHAPQAPPGSLVQLHGFQPCALPPADMAGVLWTQQSCAHCMDVIIKP